MMLPFCEVGQCSSGVVLNLCAEEEKGEGHTHPVLRIHKVGEKEGQWEQVNLENSRRVPETVRQ